MARIAVIGPGAVGATVAAWLTQDPAHDVTICARTPLRDLQVETPSGRIQARPNVLTAIEQSSPVDWIIIATKAYDSKAAADWLPSLMGGHSRVAVLQNGIEHREPFAGRVDPARLVPAIVDIPAERTATDRIVQRRFGSIKVADDTAGRDFAILFANTPIDVSVTQDFEDVAWRKLALNCAGAVNALTLRPAIIARDEQVAAVIRGMVMECIEVARAAGVELPQRLADEVVESYRDADPQSINSLHADRLAGRPMEVEARNGVIVRIGSQHGVPTPLNAMAAALLGVLNLVEKGAVAP